jgi:hypothetical protein
LPDPGPHPAEGSPVQCAKCASERYRMAGNRPGTPITAFRRARTLGRQTSSNERITVADVLGVRDDDAVPPGRVQAAGRLDYLRSTRILEQVPDLGWHNSAIRPHLDVGRLVDGG